MKQTLTSFTITPATPWGSAPKVRLYANSRFRATTGELHPAGSESENYTLISLSASGDGFTFPTTVFDTTDDSSDPNATYSAVVYNGAKMVYALFDRWAFKASLGSTVTWDDLETANVTRVPLRDDTAYSKVQTDLRIASQLGVSNPATVSALGRVKMSVAPADATSPVAVSTNDPRLYSNGVNIAALATGGVGTEADPYTGWDAAITTSGGWQSNTAYFFSDDHFAYSTPIVILDTNGTRLVGQGMRATRLKFTGAGVAVTFKHTGTGFRCGIEDIEIDGNPLCTRGLYTESSHAMVVRNVNVRNCSQAAFWVRFGVLNTYENIRCSLVQDIANGFSTVPAVGFTCEQRGGGETFQGCSIINPKFEILGIGMELHQAAQVVVIGGSCEQNTGVGTIIGASCAAITFIGTNNELNGGHDWDIYGDSTILDGVLSTGEVRIRTGAHGTQIRGGQLNSLYIEANARATALWGMGFNLLGTGTITILDDSTEIHGHIYNIAAGAASGGNSLPLTSALNLGRSYALPFPAWNGTDYAVVNLGGAGSLFAHKSTAAPGINVGNNVYVDALGVARYQVTGVAASLVQQVGGDVLFMTAPPGVADAAITWTEVGKFDSDGKLYVNDAGTLKGVTYGAADSGGAGFKVLRIAN